MAAVSTTPSYLSGVAVPYALEADLSASTLGQADPIAGYPEPSEDAEGRRPALTLSATGPQTSTTTIHVATQQPGNVGSASLRWRHTVSGVTDADWRGADQPNVLVGAAFPGWGSLVDQGEMHALTMPDDTQVVVYWQANGIKRDIKAVVYDPDTDSYSSAVTLASDLSAAHSISPALCLIPDPGGSRDPILLCAYWLADATSDLAQINIVASRDFGATWSAWAESVLPDALDLTTFTLHRIRWSYLNGAIVMFTHQTGDSDIAYANFPENIRQYASSDLGASFTLIGTLRADLITPLPSAYGYPDVVTIGSLAYVAYMVDGAGAVSRVMMFPVQNAYVLVGTPESTLDDHLLFDLSEVALTTGAPPYEFTFAAFSITATPSGNIFAFLIRPIDADGTYFGYSAIYYPATRTQQDLNSNGEFWWYDSNTPSTEYPNDIAATWYRGQARVYATMSSTTATYEDRITRLDLGGCSTVTIPPSAATGTTVSTSWWWTSIPTTTADNYGWTKTTSGGTDSVTTAAGWETITTSSDTLWFGRQPTATIGQEIWQLFRVQQVSGGGVTSRSIACGIRMADGAEGYDVEARVSSTQIRLYDVNGAATIATITIDTATDGVDILIAMGAGKVSAWARTIGNDEDRYWTTIEEDYSLTDDASAGGAVNLIKWGCLSTSTSTARWVVPGGNGGSPLGQAVLSTGFDNPTDLRGQAFALAGAYVGAGVSVGATGGPTLRGDAWTIRPDAEHPIRYLIPAGDPDSDPNVRGGQRTSLASTASEWRASSTSGYVVSRFNDAANHYLPPLFVLHVEGLNAGSPSVVAYDYDAAGWTTLGTLDNVAGGLRYLRASTSSATVRVDVAGVSTGSPYFRSGELKGSYFRFSNGGKVRPILDNTEGRFGDDANAARVILTLGGIDGTEPTSGTGGAVIYARSTFVCAMTATAEYGAFGLYWSSAPVTYEGYIKATKIIPCSLEPLLYAEDFGEIRRQEDPADVYTSRTGLRRGRKVRIASRRVSTIPLIALWSQRPIVIPSEQTPIVWKAYNNASYPIAGVIGDEFGKLLGAWQRSDGSQVPIVYLRQIDATAATQTLKGDSAGLYGRVMSLAQMTDDFGRNTSGGFAQVYRGDNWTIEEEL